jgi:hypothetical protein
LGLVFVLHVFTQQTPTTNFDFLIFGVKAETRAVIGLTILCARASLFARLFLFLFEFGSHGTVNQRRHNVKGSDAANIHHTAHNPSVVIVVGKRSQRSLRRFPCH